MSKKTLVIIGIVLALILLALLGYYLFFQKNTDGTTGNIDKFKNFLPFGGPGVSTTPSGGVIEPPPVAPPSATEFTNKLRKLSSVPVAGAGTRDFKAGTVVRHIEKATGHIYETELFSPIQNRISNTTIPLAYDAIWGNNNDSMIARYLRDDNQTIDTYSLSLKSISTTTNNTISGIQFPGDITDYSIFGTSVFYLQESFSGSVGIIANFDGAKKKQIWDSPIKELLSQYVNTSTVALTTKPYQNFSGFIYFVNTATGQFKKILGDIPGLSTLVSPDATKVLVLLQADNASLYTYTISNRASSVITPTTFPEKCVWSKKDKTLIYCAVLQGFLSGSSLNSWYMGQVSFSDDIWKYDLKNNTSSIIETIANDTSELIDIIKPILSENEQYLVFINKIDGSLWSLDLTK